MCAPRVKGTMSYHTRKVPTEGQPGRGDAEGHQGAVSGANTEIYFVRNSTSEKL